jgi:hypothetical protein
MLYTIERDFTGFSDEDLNAAAFRALLCLSFFRGLDWVRSFYDPATEQGRCFYEASAANDLKHHAETMAIPIGEVRPVIEVRPVGPGRVELGEPVDKADRRGAGNPTAWIARLDLAALDNEDVAERFEAISQGPKPAWERAYIDRDIGELFAVFRTVPRREAEHRLEKLALPVKDLREMTEVLPSDITGPGGTEVEPLVKSSMAGVSR